MLTALPEEAETVWQQANSTDESSPGKVAMLML